MSSEVTEASNLRPIWHCMPLETCRADSHPLHLPSSCCCAGESCGAVSSGHEKGFGTPIEIIRNTDYVQVIAEVFRSWSAVRSKMPSQVAIAAKAGTIYNTTQNSTVLRKCKLQEKLESLLQDSQNSSEVSFPGSMLSFFQERGPAAVRSSALLRRLCRLAGSLFAQPVLLVLCRLAIPS